ncbi:mannose-6-phosphate isomerase [Vibrio ponticus]|uniref:Mannose-6-phosphate isomerase n=1 Tax=Vibrio ponticus TaxID=265668 RepID=A0A3N3E078_9VIBR|nr:AGE family epimerase/isomerase [Vibrio ponticus]ROV59990.1 mannose-6-phosphate isomerase [Vibrio ponticus]
MDSLTDQINRCQNWLIDEALPRWQPAQSPQSGIFYEGLLASGAAFSHDLVRFRVQPRQVYVFSHATELGLIEGGGSIKTAIERGFAQFGGPSTGYRFALSKHGDSDSEAINLYEQAFALLGFAWHYKLSASDSSLEAMETIYQQITHHFGDSEYGGFFLTKGNRVNKGQNPHMHLFEALMVSYEYTDDTIWLNRATQIYQLFIKHFLQKDHLAEFFLADLTLDPVIGHHVDPGHHYEWIWLLNHYEKLTGVDVNRPIKMLYKFAQRHGHNPNGLVRDEVYADGNPLRSTSRLWCQTEYLKATIALWEREPTKARQTAIDQAIEQIFIHYIKPALPGLWIDQVNELNQPINPHSPASTFYHLFLAFSEVLRLAKEY